MLSHGWEISLHTKSNNILINIQINIIIITFAKIGYHKCELSLILFIGYVVKSPAQELRGVAQSERRHLKARAGLEHFCAVVMSRNPHTGVGGVRVGHAVERYHLALIYSEHLTSFQTLFTAHFQVVGAI